MAASDLLVQAPTDPTAELELLIQEARARTRRRRARRLFAVLSLAGLLSAVLWAALPSRLARRGDGRSLFQSAVPRTVRAEPGFFADLLGYDSGQLQIRRSTSGQVVGVLGPLLGRGSITNATAVAAVGPRGFLVALLGNTDCSTRLYKVDLTSSGRVASYSPAGPAIAGSVSSIAASANGQIVAYALNNLCVKGDRGYIGVLNLATDQERRWSDIAVAGESFGKLGLNGRLSISANGRLIGFAASLSPAPLLAPTSGEVLVLPTNSLPGTVAARSHVVLRGNPLQIGPVALSPTGRSYYLCSAQQSTPGRRATVSVSAYSLGASRPYSVLTTRTPSFVGCPDMTLDPSGGALLMYYQNVVLPVGPTIQRAFLAHLAKVNTATRANSDTTISFRSSGMEQSDVLGTAW